MELSRQEVNESRVQAVHAQIPQEAISKEQVETLTTQLEALHATQLLSDDELYVFEDIGLCRERATIGSVMKEVVQTNKVVNKLHQLVVVSEAGPRDATLGPQLRCKFT